MSERTAQVCWSPGDLVDFGLGRLALWSAISDPLSASQNILES